MGTQGFGGVLATPLVGRGLRRQSATGSIVPVADLGANSATFGSLVDQRLQLSSRIRCSGLLSPEAADFVLELADAGSGLLGAGSGLFGAG